MISKKYTFLNVGNQASFLGNIKNAVDITNAGVDYGWTVDRYVSGDDGELLVHSNGAYGNQNLYYSIKLRVPDSGVSNIHLCGQTGYNSGSNYDAQPGKFTMNATGLGSQWNGSDNNYPSNYVKSPVSKQVVFVNKQFIMVFWRQDVTLLSPPGNTYPLWCRLFIGAMDSFFPTTETLLNWVDEVTWGRYGWTSSMFCGGQKHLPYYNGGWPTVPKPTTGLLWKQPYDASPVNKELFWPSESWTNPMRWFSTINHYDNYCYYTYSGGYIFYTRNVSSWRNGGGFYTDSTRFNVSVVKHFLHRPVVWFYEYLNAQNVFLHPLCYLPYKAVRMTNLLKGDDVISYGTRNFSVYPDCRDGVDFGCAIEFIEG
jgi:hypothetical protein